MRLQLSACLLIVTFTTSCGGLAISKPHAGYDVVLDDSASIATSSNEEPNSELARRETSEAQSPDIVQRRSLFSNLTSLGDSAKDFVMQEFAQVFSNNKTLTSATVAPLEALGITGATDDGSGAGLNGFNNSNPNPSTSIYPQRSSGDAPYSNSETVLRGALYIPSGFQSNKTKQPILMCPGTGALGGQTYENNMLKLFQQSDSPLDPVILNVPGFLVDDIQSNSEFVAYGINYLTATTGKSIAVMTWSQGSLNVQWAMKYWPSSRQDVSDVIAISPDLKGSILEPLLCNSIVSGCGASIRQQSDSSEFVKTLRADGGDSAYVPVTTIYSATDEIVQPQFGANASGIFNDARGVGVTNSEIQSVCSNLRDQVFLHESVLFSNLAYNLALDAVANDGPGQTSRLDLNTVCGSATPDALSSLDILQTESVILTCLVNIIGAPQTQTEPSIKSYAQTAAVGKSAATSGAATKGFSVGSGVGKSGFGWAKVLTFYALVTYFLVL